AGQKMHFELHEIGEFIDRMGQTSLVDVDNDNDLDWVFGRFGDMYWYEYKSADEWDLHEIGKGARTDVGGWPADINQDGMIDFVVGDSWYENTDNPRSEKFILHRKNMISCHDNIILDIDGDGDLDVSSGGGPLSQDIHKLFIWENISGDAARWKEHIILEGRRIHEAVAADVEGDGDIDICTKPWHGGLHIYLENKLIE
ncbi:MAG: FG-GAP-like repeat-containing protein, partial [Bacteroidales bacterium]